jgi:ABC-2 type transport system ATP-binding protein
MIDFQNVSFGYSAHRTLFSDLSLGISSGGVCGLLGGNGMGKSTLLKLAAGLLIPRKGEIELAGETPAHRNPALLRQIMFVPEEFDLPSTTLQRFVGVTAPFYPNFSHELFAEYVGALQLDPTWHFRRMSMGEKKKSYIAFALACGTPYLFMDEPTNGLDIPSKSALRHLIAETTTPERTVIISTHQARDIENLLDRVVILQHGRVLADRTVAEIEDEESGRFDLEKFYLKTVENHDDAC